MTFPLPYVDAEIAFTSGSNSTQYLTLDDPARGKLGVGKLSAGSSTVGGELFEPVGAFLSAVTITRGASRLDGPLVRYDTGNAVLTLRNEDRRFDPTNLDGPYVVGSGTPTTGVWTFECTRAQSYGHAFTVAIKSDAVTGPAELRSWTPYATGTTGAFTVDKPLGVAVGDVLVAFHSSDYGTLTDMGTPTGGAAWLSLGTRTSVGSESLKSKVWWKRATSADVALPATGSYGFTQFSNADGVLTIACIRFADATAVPVIAQMGNDGLAAFDTPAVTPAGPNDYELRWVAGVGGGAGAAWQRSETAVGFTEISDLQSNAWATGALFARALVSVGAGETQITPMRAVRLLSTWGTEANYVANSLLQVMTGAGGGTLAGWQAGAGTTLTSTSDRAYLGGYCAKLTKVSGSTFSMSMTSGAYFSLAEGLPVTISFWVYVPESAYAGLDALYVADATFDGAFTGTFIGKPDVSDRWVRMSHTTTVATATQLRGIQIQFWTNGSHAASATIAYVDAVQVVAAARPETFTTNRERFPLFRGFIDYWDILWSMDNGPLWSEVSTPASDAFTFLSNFKRTAQDTVVGAGEDTGARIARVLDQVGWPIEDRLLDAGDSVLQGTTHDGDALGEMQQAAESELGELYMDGSGKVVFRRRNAVLEEERSTVPQWVFGDDTDNPQELPWQDLKVSYDTAQMFNVVEEARVGGEAQAVQSTTSITRNLARPFSRTDLLLTTDAEVLAHANMILAMSKDPELRFDSLTINAYRDPARLFPAVLSIRIGDRIRIYRRPPGGGLPIIRDVIVRGITHSIGQVQWETTFSLQSATKYDDVTPF